MIPYGAKVRVPSLSNAKGGDWTVSRAVARFGTDPLLSCDCPSHNRKREGCKHVELVRAADRLMDKCTETHGGNGQQLCLSCLVAVLALTKRKLARDYEPKGSDHHADLRALAKFLGTKKVASGKDPLGLVREWVLKRMGVDVAQDKS